MKTFDEALKKVLPSRNMEDIDRFGSLYGNNIYEDLLQCDFLTEVLCESLAFAIAKGSLHELTCLVKSSFCLGVAIGIEMEKEELCDNQSEPKA